MNLNVSRVSKTYFKSGLAWRPNAVHAVKNISFELKPNESLGLVGESGSGKTTLSKMIAGFEKPSEGKILFDTDEVDRLPLRTRARRVQMVFQDPFASLNPKLLLATQLEEGMLAHGIGELDKKARQLMEDVGLDPAFLHRYPHQLSGGQRQRFAIARALSLEPSLLIADEPVSSLDLSIQAQIINLLNRLRDKHGFSMIVVAHDLAVVGHLCDRIIVMKDGEKVEEASADQLLTNPASAYARELLQATPTL